MIVMEIALTTMITTVYVMKKKSQDVRTILHVIMMRRLRMMMVLVS